MEALEALLPYAVFSTLFGVVYVCVTAWHRQRMALIEKGADPNLFVQGRRGSVALAIGLLLVGIGLGLFLGHLVARVMPATPTEFDPHPNNPLPYFIMVMLCGGAALLIYHFIVRARHKG